MKKALLLALAMTLGVAHAQTATTSVTTNPKTGQILVNTVITPAAATPAPAPAPAPTSVPTPTPAPAPITPAQPTSYFQGVWTPGFLTPITPTAKWVVVKGGLPHTNFGVDVNFEVLTTNSQPATQVIQDGDWANRSSGTQVLGSIPLPPNFIVPNPSGGDTPNNPLIVYNSDANWGMGVNGVARPKAGGPLYGYTSTPTSNHGGSQILGGETTDAELKTGINHALAIDIWGQKYLNKANKGFVAPALRADSAYAQSGSSDYYGSSLPIAMGSRLAIPASVTAQSLGITSTAGKNLLAAMQKYGAIVVDNSAWDCFYINATGDAESDLYAIQSEVKKLETALQVVQ